MNRIKKVLEGIYNNPEIRRKVVPLFISTAGIGKTKIIKDFMVEKGVYHPEKVLLLSGMMPFEVSGTAIANHEKQLMVYYDFDRLLRLKDGDILFLDEIPNANILTLNAFLTFLESRIMASGKELPNIMIVAAGNPHGMPPFTPQIKERFIWYELKFSRTMWSDYMRKKYKMPDSIIFQLSDLIKNEDFSKNNNFYTPRSIDKAVEMIINEIPTPYENTIKPILSTLVDNKLKRKIKLSEEIELEENEKIDWLKLIKLYKEMK